VEEECRILFLTLLQPLINGCGSYHVESETRDAQRMDVVVDYGTDQFIIELKLWYGDAKHEKALDQLFCLAKIISRPYYPKPERLLSNC